MPTHDVKKYVRNAKPKVDTSDPTPWARHPRTLQELTESEGFLINPRFKSMVELSNFRSAEELLRKFCWTDEELRSFQHSQEKGTSGDQPATGEMKCGETKAEATMGSWAVEDIEEKEDKQTTTEGDKATPEHEGTIDQRDSLSEHLSSTGAVDKN